MLRVSRIAHVECGADTTLPLGPCVSSSQVKSSQDYGFLRSSQVLFGDYAVETDKAGFVTDSFRMACLKLADVHDFINH